jgi:hypothetical protein
MRHSSAGGRRGGSVPPGMGVSKASVPGQARNSVVSMSVSGSALAIPLYLQDVKNETALADKFAQTDTTTKMNIDRFEAAAPTLTTYAAFAKNYQAMSTVLGAYDLSDDIGYPALVKQLATQDPTSSSSTAQKLGNTNALAFAKAMNQYTSNPFASSTTMDSVVSAYKVNSFEKGQDSQVPGMSDALEFTRQASQVTSVAQLMSNSSMLKVAVAKTGLDWTTYGNMDYNQQVALITKTIKLSDLQNSTKVQQMAENFLVQSGQDPTATGATTASATTISDLLGGSSTNSVLALFGGSSSTSILDLFG